MRRVTRHRARPWAALVPVIGVAVALSGCGGSERSAEAYCTAFYEKAAPIRAKYVDAADQADTNPLGAMVRVLQAPGDLAVIFDGMVPHAPDEIRSDTEAARDALRRQQDQAGEGLSNPLGALGRALLTSISASGSFERVDAYLNEHCPVDSPLAQRIIRESS